MVVRGFGAAGSAGKASSLLLFRDAEAACLGGFVELDAPTQDGFVTVVEELAGRAGKAEDGGGRTDDCGGVQVVDDPALLALPRRVLFFSRRTRVECFCDGAAAGAVGDAAAAAAHPLDEVVAPCMPPRPGSEG